jgi:hypothetical protein
VPSLFCRPPCMAVTFLAKPVLTNSTGENGSAPPTTSDQQRTNYFRLSPKSIHLQQGPSLSIRGTSMRRRRHKSVPVGISAIHLGTWRYGAF